MAKVLTERFVSTLKAPPEGRRLTVFDSRQPGLCIRVTSTGNRSFYVVSRAPAGKQRWAEVRDGNAPVTSLARARELAPAGVANIKNGREAFPRIEAEPEKDAYETVVARFVKQYAEPRQRTWKETARILNATPWGKRPFGEITKKDAIAYLDGLVAEGKRATAAITLRWLKTLWRWAARRDLVASPIMDPLSAEQDFAIIPAKRERVYSDAELKALWNATGRLSAKERAYLKLLMLTGSRAGALAGMRRSELDSLERPTLWTVPPERVKQRKSREHKGRVYLVPLSPLARRVFVPLLKGQGDLVFPSASRSGVTMDCGSPLARKIRGASSVADWTAHAHRHTVATWLQNEGHDEYDRALVLQHAGAGTVTGRYSHGHSLDRARELLDKWADHVAAVTVPEGAELLA